ncbi:hypothetical protein Vadar_000783 [Vaccinium darrowii]|uniref:Uncharacterized protein n=1 Tax=Vaccinium darrowii TaxID=229202 RepID=A0ACB7XMD0_9ERIC|nr:hypothetical protein Vadar_000783 [Vaccinium darrowii]
MTPLPTPATPSPAKIADGSGDTVADEEYAFQIPNNAVKGLEAPSIGMTFETIEEARKYYEEYGRQKGFWIRTRTSSKGRNRANEVSSMLLVCAKEGKHVAKTNNDGVIEGNGVRDQDEKVIPKKRVRSCSTIRCGCEAHLLITRGKWSAKWKVTVFSDIHNHQLVTPAKRMKMKSNRHMPKAVKDLTEAFHRENLEISKVPSIFGGEHIGFDNRDCYNHLRNHAAKVYTRNLFNKFKDERSEVALYKVEDVGNANGFQLFVVKSKEYDIKKFTVTLDLQTFEGKCECQKFEFVGILCAHILKVFVRQDIDTIPDHFILPRWRQKANKFRIIDSEELVHDDGKEESEALRLSHMCQESTKLACLAAPSNEAYTIYIEAMNDLSTKLLKISSYVPPIHVCDEKNDLNSTEPSQILLSDPNISQTKGRKKDVKGKDTSIHSGRLKSGIELALNKKKRKCNLCKKFGHDKRTCPKNPTSKSNKDYRHEDYPLLYRRSRLLSSPEMGSPEWGGASSELGGY